MNTSTAGFLTVSEAGRRLACSGDEVLRLADLGHLTRLRTSAGTVVFRLAEVESLRAEDRRH